MRTERVDVPDRVLGRRGLGGAAKGTARAVAEALFTTRDGPPPADRLDWLVDDLDDFVAQSGPRAGRVFGLCLFAISFLGPLLAFRLVPFRWLSLSTRTRALERMERSPFALALFGAKALLCIVYYEHPDAAATIGFDGTCLTGEHSHPAGNSNGHGNGPASTTGTTTGGPSAPRASSALSPPPASRGAFSEGQ
ncbi:MAG: hypothetical protein DRJ42_12995 [Deltaproteobacteria bacterium]|nr:MAG: hypothetical protein DRJ42_12995 [Deltaproteobacteria bacterium]